VNGATGREGGLDRSRSEITAPVRVTVRRPRQGWVAGLVGGAVTLVARLLVFVLALAVLARVTAVLWWAGLAQIPVVVLIYALIVVAVGGFAAGRSGRLAGGRSWLPEGPRQVTWQPGRSRVQTGVVWEQDDVPAAQLAGQDELPLTWRTGQEDSP
jgi:hypothetical protein